MTDTAELLTQLLHAVEAMSARLSALEARLTAPPAGDPMWDFLLVAFEGMGGAENKVVNTAAEFLLRMRDLPNGEAVRAALLRAIPKPTPHRLGRLLAEAERRGPVGGIVVMRFGEEHRKTLWGIRPAGFTGYNP